ncbi:uncharacterized protein [Bemisia tabaci]|uniref:uncharacterized protein isoform X3 n=1 Tax=Bemisia tabaci TaxID=7038 RepID=UPI003B281118
MANQHFCLRWNNHQSTLVSVFDSLLESGTLVDCTLAAEGRCIQAHKVLLSACSPYFAMILSQHYDKHPILILKDVKFHELQSMLDYMYRGEVNITQENLGSFLKAAESLQIKGLTDSGGGGEREAGLSSACASPVFHDKDSASPSPVSKIKLDTPMNNIRKPQPVLPNLSQVSRSQIPPVAGLTNQPKKPLKHIIDSLNKNNEVIKRRKPIQPMKFENNMIVSPMSARSHLSNHLDVSNALDVPAQAPSIPVPENKAMYPLLPVPSSFRPSSPSNQPQSLVVDKENKECDSTKMKNDAKMKSEYGSEYSNHDDSTMDQYNDEENEDDGSGSDFEKAGPSHDNNSHSDSTMRWESSSDGTPHDMTTSVDSQEVFFGSWSLAVGQGGGQRRSRYNDSDNNQFQCCQCGRKYRYAMTLRRHLQYECGKNPQFECSLCPYKTKRKCNLKTHLIVKHDTRDS